jgi:N-acetylneuraminic acid mutarotase
MAAAHAGRLYVFGGARADTWQPAATTWAYDPAADTWSELAAMPEPRMAGAAVALDGFLYVAGGVGGSQALLRYDPALDSWTALASLNQPREHVAAVALGGKIYALAGRWSVIGELNSVEVYDPAANAWSAGTPMNVARGGLAAAILQDRIVVAGGEVIITHQETLDSVELFDPARGEWALAPALPGALHGVPAAVVDNTFTSWAARTGRRRWKTGDGCLSIAHDDARRPPCTARYVCDAL